MFEITGKYNKAKIYATSVESKSIFCRTYNQAIN